MDVRGVVTCLNIHVDPPGMARIEIRVTNGVSGFIFYSVFVLPQKTLSQKNTLQQSFLLDCTEI